MRVYLHTVKLAEMAMKSVATLSQQIEDLLLHLRTIRSNVRKAEKELDQGFSRRSRRPFESALRWRRYRDATDLQMIAEACLHDLRKTQAIRLAPFKPGDQVLATLVFEDVPATEARFGIWDVEPGEKGAFSYEAIAITQAGKLSKRFRVQPLWTSRYSLRVCDLPLEQETAKTLEWRRQVCDDFLSQTVNVGSLERFEIVEAGWMGHRSVRNRT